VIRDFNHEAAAKAYTQTVKAHQDLFGDDVLVIDHFGQADFMGPYSSWGYENYLTAAAMDPQAMRRYYHYTALHGRLQNEALVLAVEKHGLPPFAYTGQDICGANGPLMSPRDAAGDLLSGAEVVPGAARGQQRAHHLAL
jgi:hypothetical protein